MIRPLQRNRNKAIGRQKGYSDRETQRTPQTEGARTAESQAEARKGNGKGLVPASHAPIDQCKIPTRLFELGIGNVVISRRHPSGQISLAIFLLDVYCLGVKDVFHRLVDPSQYANIMAGLARDSPLEDIDLTCARKLIEGAVEYARQFQLTPHPDYKTARTILGEVDAAACPRDFEYGRDGKPFYVAGPNDSPATSRRILSLLEQQCGPDGFHYMIPTDLSPEGV
ncbi:protein of unknown function [Candidatus Methylomirabilis oxygeniifera]|uniref:Uncharacterized protein n=1 Tax=Methylomirabilis oxygeniifera TaxID=671143 RepID=D5MH36_METO1|nr:protein of unknown function [Candidatus Methylomirabilis oxyfera]